MSARVRQTDMEGRNGGKAGRNRPRTDARINNKQRNIQAGNMRERERERKKKKKEIGEI